MLLILVSGKFFTTEFGLWNYILLLNLVSGGVLLLRVPFTFAILLLILVSGTTDSGLWNHALLLILVSRTTLYY